MRNQTSFRLTTTLLPTDLTAKTTTVINKVDAGGNKFYPTFTEETVVITNDDRTVMETTRATCNNWVLTFVKRWLSDDNSETQVANRKLTWNPWSLCFITAWAWDWIDRDDSVTWTGNQTYTGNLTSTGTATYNWMLITNKWVKYPSFADVDELNAYEWAFGGMFATVDDTWELYRYNAVTEQWDLVSTVELWQYIIRVDDEPPSQWTADNIVTIAPELHSIYVWEDAVVDNNYVDVLLVWWWGWGGGASSQDSAWWWWGWGWVEYKQAHRVVWTSFSVTVWAWGSWWDAVAWTDWWVSSFWNLRALWWWGGWVSFANWSVWNNGWGAWCPNTSWTATYWWVGYATSFNLWHNWADGNRDTGYWNRYRGGQWGSSQFNWTATTALNSGSSFNIWWYTLYAAEWWWGGEHWHYSSSWGSSSDSNYYCTQWSSSTAVWWWGGGAAKEWNNYSDRQMGQSTWWNGQNGIVIIAYPTDWSYWFTSATWWTITTSTAFWKQYKVHTFTANWTFTIIS